MLGCWYLIAIIVYVCYTRRFRLSLLKKAWHTLSRHLLWHHLLPVTLDRLESGLSRLSHSAACVPGCDLLLVAAGRPSTNYFCLRSMKLRPYAVPCHASM